jgi:hypothetical protein
MMEKKYILGFSLIIFIMAIVVYNSLPFQIKYFNKIITGTKIIEELDNYYVLNGKYPNENDFRIIEKIYRKSFLKNNIEFDISIQPYYYNKGSEYILAFIFGFDGPDLFYYSRTKEWKYGIVSSILFSEE